VKILSCISKEWIVDEEDLSWIISLCDLEQKSIFTKSWK
jgi:hypothetical protein